jgi:uncharacterized protein with NAD-binding domain and iron-sulfur cluster
MLTCCRLLAGDQSLATPKKIEVAVVGGGCASVAAAFELTRPEHGGKYHVTLYQLGWRLGGKGASGRGPADRIEEHGLHVWLGSYDNAFRLLRECYAELGVDWRRRRFANWRDAFFPDSYLGMADRSREGGWVNWTALFPPAQGLPGDPFDQNNPFTMRSYFTRTIELLRTLLFGLETRVVRESGFPGHRSETGLGGERSPGVISDSIGALLSASVVVGAAALIEAIALVESALRSFPQLSEVWLLRLLEMIAAAARNSLEEIVEDNDESRSKWEIIDIVLATLVGTLKFGLFSDPRGFDSIDEYECRDWLRINGASERSLNSAYLRALYDLGMAYENGDPNRPRISAGQALRGSVRFFFGYRGALFWKMRAGMGDVVFAPFYETLAKRGVTFRFFHRLTNVQLAAAADLAPGEKPYVRAIEFDVQAKVLGGADYSPLIEVKGARCWPSEPDYSQLEDGDRLSAEGRQFESHWDWRKVATETLRVVQDFDCVLLGVSIGAIPEVCRELVAHDPRWRDMVANIKTVATQAFQIWLAADVQALGWDAPPVTLSGFVKPFDTWADMAQVIPAESWRSPPSTVAYFCSVLGDPPAGADLDDPDYPSRRREDVRRSAVAFLNLDIQYLWPNCVEGAGGFRWDLLVDPNEDAAATHPRAVGEARFGSQFWTANVNPSDRYVLALPGTLKYRISPLDDTYDNLTIAGDWTECGFNQGCVEAAFMSGRLAANAIAGAPALEDIVAYDHP